MGKFKPIFGTNDEFGPLNMKNYGGGEEHHDHEITLFVPPSQLWMWEMDVLASGRRFSIPTCSHIVYIAWGSMGRWWNATEGEN